MQTRLGLGLLQTALQDWCLRQIRLRAGLLQAALQPQSIQQAALQWQMSLCCRAVP